MKYTNYLSIGYHLKKKHFPIKGLMRDGRLREYVRQEEIWFDLFNATYDSKEDIVTVNDMRLKGGVTNGDFASIFMNKEYESLPLTGRVVIDIGANIADSSIYFINKGAKKVYAVEPNRFLYELADENVRLNSMSDHIQTIFAGCSAETSQDSYPPFLSLEDIIHNYRIDPDFLKIDCEGCEYDIILNTSERILQCFNYILVEYHYGYRKIKEKLEKCGFRTKISGPTYYPQTNKPNNAGTMFSVNLSKVETGSLIKPFIGYVYATKNGFFQVDERRNKYKKESS